MRDPPFFMYMFLDEQKRTGWVSRSSCLSGHSLLSYAFE